MAQLLIVYHSKTGGSRKMAEAAAAAAREETQTILKMADQAGPDDLLRADGYIFSAPENLAAIAGVMKDFYDRSYYPAWAASKGAPMPKWYVQVQMAKAQCAKQRALPKVGG